MLTFFFWNVCGPGLKPGDIRYKEIEALIQRAVKQYSVDIVVLAESPFEGNLHLMWFSEMPTYTPKNTATGCRLEIYAQPFIKMSPAGGVGRGTIQELVISESPDPLLFGAVHLSSRLAEKDDFDRREREGRAIEYAHEIIRVEELSAPLVRRTIVVGDFNYEPYELPMVYTHGFNAVANKAQANRLDKKTKPKPRPYFYNPMWSHFGDAVEGPSGTYCHEGYWRMPDQVLVRPALLSVWKDRNLQIISSIGGTSLLNRSAMPKSKDTKGFASDHLPLLFSLDI